MKEDNIKDKFNFVKKCEVCGTTFLITTNNITYGISMNENNYGLASTCPNCNYTFGIPLYMIKGE